MSAVLPRLRIGTNRQRLKRNSAKNAAPPVVVHFLPKLVQIMYSALCGAVLEALKGLNTTKSRLNELHHSMCFCVLKCGCVWSECWWKYLANEAATAIRNRDNLQFCTSFFANVIANFVLLLLDLHLAAAPPSSLHVSGQCRSDEASDL